MLVVPAPLLMNVPARLIVVAAAGVMVPSEGLAGVRTGASFTLVTVSEAVSAAVLKAVAPPSHRLRRDRPARRPCRWWRPMPSR